MLKYSINILKQKCVVFIKCVKLDPFLIVNNIMKEIHEKKNSLTK